MTTPLYIVTDGPPIFTPCRKLHGDKKTQVEEQLLQWERDKVIERCESSWASPIHDVKKYDGSWRVCGDFRRINTVTQLDRYPLPTLSSFNERLVGCTVYINVDLRQAFQLVCVEESSKEKTAIITTLGLFKFLRMPFGLKKRGPMLPAKCASASVRSAIRNIHLRGWFDRRKRRQGTTPFGLALSLPEAQGHGSSPKQKEVWNRESISDISGECRQRTRNFNSIRTRGSDNTVPCTEYT